MYMYIGTKQVLGTPMNRKEYNDYRGWDYPENEAGMENDAGYLVEYLDSGKPNHPDHIGYISWSPKEQFDNAYRQTDCLSFGYAIEAMKVGLRVARKGWNGKNMFIFRVPGSTFKVNRAPLLGIYQEGTKINYRAHYDMRTADGDIVPWICSQSDMDEDDWIIVE